MGRRENPLSGAAFRIGMQDVDYLIREAEASGASAHYGNKIAHQCNAGIKLRMLNSFGPSQHNPKGAIGPPGNVFSHSVGRKSLFRSFRSSHSE